MADISPTGTATNMATAEMRSVPVKRGTMPNAPEAPTWSERIAVCGLHSTPKRKSKGDTLRKKRSASNSTDSTMPAVVRMATVELATMKTRTAPSTWLRARNRGETRRHMRTRPSSATRGAATLATSRPRSSSLR